MIIFNYPNILFSSDGWKCYKLRRLYFIWVCRDIESFRWFADLLCTLHSKVMGVARGGRDNFITARYVHTRSWHAVEKGSLAQNKQAPAVLLLGLPDPDSVYSWSCTNQLDYLSPVFCCSVLPCTTSLDTYPWGLWNEKRTCRLGSLSGQIEKRGGGDLQFQVDFKSGVAS